jgi:ubiquitin-protein ligase
MPAEYNPKSPSVKRIFREMKEMNEIMEGPMDGRTQFAAEALESDIFEWHFAVRGPDGTDFESGIYHGRILLPHDYPFKPPSFIMLTPVRSGNWFKVQGAFTSTDTHITKTAALSEGYIIVQPWCVQWSAIFHMPSNLSGEQNEVINNA